MDKDVLKMLAHLDQTRAAVQTILKGMPADEVTDLIRTCGRGCLSDLDERVALLVGLLAIISISSLLEYGPAGLDEEP